MEHSRCTRAGRASFWGYIFMQYTYRDVRASFCVVCMRKLYSTIIGKINKGLNPQSVSDCKNKRKITEKSRIRIGIGPYVRVPPSV